MRVEPAPPSGRQVRITAGQQEAVVVEVGGGLRSYRVAGRDVLDGYGEHEPCSGARGQPLIPWPNRLDRGQYEWDEQRQQTPVHEVDLGNALHGFTRWHNWHVIASAPHEAVATLRLPPQQGYPFILDLTITYTLHSDGLRVTTTARNAGDSACPYAEGAHPYITVATAWIDAAVLTVPASTYLLSDDAMIPVGRATVAGTAVDFREARVLGSVRLNHAFTDLKRGSDGLARVVMASDTTRRTVTLWLDEGYRWVMLFTGDALPEAQRRRGLAVEPMTAPPNAFASGEDVTRLEPGEMVTTRWGISVEDW